jgi:hypothetical protein
MVLIPIHEVKKRCTRSSIRQARSIRLPKGGKYVPLSHRSRDTGHTCMSMSEEEGNFFSGLEATGHW